MPNIITVTTHDPQFKMHPTSNWGKQTVDIAAPGDRIKSTLPYGRAGFLTGTSQSTAFVTGVAALIKARLPQITAKQIKDYIVQSAIPATALKDKSRSGGRLNASAAWQLANQELQPTDTKRSVASDAKIIYRLKGM
jgi:subtilisin family serine protease